MLPEMPADFCMGCKTLPEIQFILLHGGVNVARNAGRLLHGVHNLPRDSGQTLPRWGMTYWFMDTFKHSAIGRIAKSSEL